MKNQDFLIQPLNSGALCMIVFFMYWDPIINIALAVRYVEIVYNTLFFFQKWILRNNSCLIVGFLLSLHTRRMNGVRVIRSISKTWYCHFFLCKLCIRYTAPFLHPSFFSNEGVTWKKFTASVLQHKYIVRLMIILFVGLFCYLLFSVFSATTTSSEKATLTMAPQKTKPSKRTHFKSKSKSKRITTARSKVSVHPGGLT